MQYKSKNHHYVSQFYLEYFACNQEGTLVNAMTKKGRIIDKSNVISDISSDKNYNSTLQESEQCKLERNYATILKNFLNMPNAEKSHHFNCVIKFVCFMLANNIETRKSISDKLGEMDVQIDNFPSDHTVTIDRGHKARLNLSMAFADAVFEEIQNWKFTLSQTNGYKVFITSDNPVSIFKPENILIPMKSNITWINPKITNFDESIPLSDEKMRSKMNMSIILDKVSFEQDVIMAFPITPNFCLMGFSDSERHKQYIKRPVQSNNNVITFVNLITLGCSNKVVYAHSKDVLQMTRDGMSSFMNYCKAHQRDPSFDVAILQ